MQAQFTALNTIAKGHSSITENIFESGVKHLTSNGQMMDQTFVYVVHNIKHLWVIM
jgi:UDP-N-acetylglucosamine enolpyruvyl transferase